MRLRVFAYVRVQLFYLRRSFNHVRPKKEEKRKLFYLILSHGVPQRFCILSVIFLMHDLGIDLMTAMRQTFFSMEPLTVDSDARSVVSPSGRSILPLRSKNEIGEVNEARREVSPTVLEKKEEDLQQQVTRRNFLLFKKF